VSYDVLGAIWAQAGIEDQLELTRSAAGMRPRTIAIPLTVGWDKVELEGWNDQMVVAATLLKVTSYRMP
jgi:hypothetical protein